MTQTPQTKLRFGAKRRLKSAASISQVFSPENKLQFSFSTPYFRVLAIPSETSRLAVVMQKKNFKHAVTRNKLKRLVREYFRTHPEEVAGADIVILGKRSLIIDKPNNKKKEVPAKDKKAKLKRTKKNLVISDSSISSCISPQVDLKTFNLKPSKKEIRREEIKTRRQEKALYEEKQDEVFKAACQSLDFAFGKMQGFFTRRKEESKEEK